MGHAPSARTAQQGALLCPQRWTELSLPLMCPLCYKSINGYGALGTCFLRNRVRVSFLCPASGPHPTYCFPLFFRNMRLSGPRVGQERTQCRQDHSEKRSPRVTQDFAKPTVGGAGERASPYCNTLRGSAVSLQSEPLTPCRTPALGLAVPGSWAYREAATVPAQRTMHSCKGLAQR